VPRALTPAWLRRIAGTLGAALCVVASATRAEAACTVSTTGVNFGAYSVFDPSPTDTTGTLTVRCTGLNFIVTATLSTGSSGSYAMRTLRRGTETLNYNLFADATRTSVLGDGNGGTSDFGWFLLIGNQTRTETIYGRIFAGQDVSVGNYTDTVLVTVNF
jgi:spore coat protein U-like protein